MSLIENYHNLDNKNKKQVIAGVYCSCCFSMIKMMKIGD